MAPLLELHGVSKSFGGLRVIQNLDLTVGQRVVGVMLSDPNSNLWRNSLLAAMHASNCFYQFFSNQVLE